MPQRKHRVLVIPDTQSPFEHEDTIPFLKKVASVYKTDTVVHIGDEMDFHAMSDYEHDPDGFSAGHELLEGLKFMKKLYKLFPAVKVCVSNHTARPFRKAYKSGLPVAFLRSYGDFLQAPSTWEWADKWEIDGVIYEHGMRQGGVNAHMKTAMSNHKSTVIGHHHSNAGVSYQANDVVTIWGMAVGCLIDMTKYSFKYAKNYARQPILGCGVVIEGHPLFIPMNLVKNRWDGVV